MGGYSANSNNVNFAFDTALLSARDLYTLAGVVDTKHDARATEATSAVDEWEGGHRHTFDEKLTTEGADASTIKDALIVLADKFASEWAAAWGEQDRINFARYVQHEKDDDSWVEDGAELVVGEDDYGEPPADPPVPEPPDYPVTREPMHVEHENSDNPRTSYVSTVEV
jgi:hypothetical protein